MRDVSQPLHKATARQATMLDMTTELFAALDVYHDQGFRLAAMNMAIDEALLETADRPIIRFYRWNRPAVSFGYFGKFADVEDFGSERDLVRRWTGGGIVFHGEDLTYSIVIPASDPVFAEASMLIYEKIHRALSEVLLKAGQCAAVAGVDDPGASRTGISGINDAGYKHCFENPVLADVMLNGKKIAGAAQRRAKRGLLQQGSIQYVDLTSDFEHRFAEALSKKIEKRSFNGDVVGRAEEVAAQKYATEAWLRKR